MKHKLLPLVFMVFLFPGCDKQRVYDHYMTTEEGLWTWKQVGVFEVDMNDSLSLHNVYIQVRHSVDYPLSNLYMYVHVKGPSGQHYKDTVNLVLANPDGSWIGRGSTRLRELRLLYRKAVLFSEPGLYTFSLEQAMRREKLPVTDVGLRIEKINP